MDEKNVGFWQERAAELALSLSRTRDKAQAELNAAQAEISRLRASGVALHDDGKELYRQRAMAETENRNLRGANAAANAIIAQQAEEMKRISDVDQDRPRLDWLERNRALLNFADNPQGPHLCVNDPEGGEPVHFRGRTYREVIDVAMMTTP